MVEEKGLLAAGRADPAHQAPASAGAASDTDPKARLLALARTPAGSQSLGVTAPPEISARRSITRQHGRFPALNLRRFTSWTGMSGASDATVSPELSIQSVSAPMLSM
jgi:hypothetical protein